jgi:transmembrane sensor
MDTPDPASFARDAISERAAAFFERQRFGEWTETDQAELDAWFAQSILHEVAFLRLEGSIALAEDLVALRPFEPAAGGDGRFAWRRFAVPLVAAASLALAVMLEKPILNYLVQAPDRTYSTDVGGRTLLTFADHSQIELDTDTAARFRITGEERTVWLEKGAAWFHISHNAANPFTVIVGKHRVTDLGTEFLVRRGAEGMEVALLNGRATLSTEGAQTATLTPGDDAIVTPASTSVARKTPQQLADALAWRRGMLVFRNAKLSDVVREFNRYNTTKLVIADPGIADDKITADIKTDDYESFLRLSAAALSLRADRKGNVILISREQRGETKKSRARQAR